MNMEINAFIIYIGNKKCTTNYIISKTIQSEMLMTYNSNHFQNISVCFD